MQPDPRFAYPSAEHKIAIAKMGYAADQKRGLAVLTGPVGAGKCLAPGTPVLLYDGTVRPVEWIRRGDLLMGPDSRPRRVLSLASGSDEMYRVRPTKGDPYIVNKAHILSLRNTKGVGRRSGQVVNISVADYLEESPYFRENAKGYRVGVDFPNQEIDIDPYFLGLWLGDGSSSCPRINTTDVPVVDFLEEYAQSLGLSVCRVTIKGDRCPAYDISNGFRGGRTTRPVNPVLDALRRYDLIQNKHIPQEFKANSRSVRLGLLAGLIDSDGHLTHSCYDLVFKSRALADDVAFLARSLGFAAFVKPCKKTCSNEKSGLYWRISISGHTDEIPVRIPRKKAPPRRQAKDVLLTGIKVEYLYRGIYFGFELDGDGLFLLGDFTVTHNTTVANQLQLAWSDDPSKTVGFLPSASDRTPAAFLRRVLEAFGQQPTRAAADNLRFLEFFLLGEHREGRHPVLLLDEGQDVHPDNIDTIADLTNFQTARSKLITVVMLAQDNLPNKLERKDKFRSRIAVIGHLDPLSFEDTCGMIAHRLVAAGGGPLENYFDKESLHEVYNTTRGIPRDICILCDSAFVNGYVRNQRIMDAALLERTVDEMRIEKRWPVQVAESPSKKPRKPKGDKEQQQ